MGTGEFTMTGLAEDARQKDGMRIAYLLSQFPLPTETFAVSDIAALQAQGHRLSVHTMKFRNPRKGNSVSTSQVPLGVDIFRSTLRGMLRWPSFLWNMRLHVLALVGTIFGLGWRSPMSCLTALLCVPRALEIVEEIDRLNPRIVHLFWARHAALVLTLLKASGSKAGRTAFVGAYDLVADDFLVELAVGSADVIFSHAETNRRYLESRAPAGARIEIVHRGIPLADLSGDAARDSALWVTASALVRAKNVEGVLRAFAHARTVRSELVLRIFGDGPDRQRLEKYALSLGCVDAVNFMGHVSRTELFYHMQQADVFLLLSKKPSERLPNVVKEALWAGCTVISSDSPGIKELIPDDSVGLTVDPDDLTAVCQVVQAVLDRDENRNAKRRNTARRWIAEHFSVDASMQKYTAVWRDLVEDSKNEASG